MLMKNLTEFKRINSAKEFKHTDSHLIVDGLYQLSISQKAKLKSFDADFFCGFNMAVPHDVFQLYFLNKNTANKAVQD